MPRNAQRRPKAAIVQLGEDGRFDGRGAQRQRTDCVRSTSGRGLLADAARPEKIEVWRRESSVQAGSLHLPESTQQVWRVAYDFFCRQHVVPVAQATHARFGSGSLGAGLCCSTGRSLSWMQPIRSMTSPEASTPVADNILPAHTEDSQMETFR